MYKFILYDFKVLNKKESYKIQILLTKVNVLQDTVTPQTDTNISRSWKYLPFYHSRHGDSPNWFKYFQELDVPALQDMKTSPSSHPTTDEVMMLEMPPIEMLPRVERNARRRKGRYNAAVAQAEGQNFPAI